MAEKKINKKILTVSIVLSAGIVFTGMFSVQDTQAAAKAKAVKIKSVTAKKNSKVTVKYKKQKNVSGYQIKFSTSKSFKKSKTVTKTVGKKKTSCSTKSFSAGDTVYVKVRSYKIVNGKKKYGRWSVIKKKTVPAGLNDSGSAEDSSANQSEDSNVDDSTDSGSVEDSTTSSGSAEDSSANQSEDSTVDDSTDTGSVEDSTGVVSSGFCGATENDDVNWSFDGSTLTISGTGKMADYSNYLYVPWSSTEIENLVIEEGVTRIGKYAFYECWNITEVIVPAGVESIGDHAFDYCLKLTTVSLPDGLLSIGSEAFFYCSKLADITIPDSVTDIGSSAFKNCRSLPNQVLPDGITEIKNSTFYGCASMSEIVIPDSVTIIGASAFASCTGLSSVTLPDGLQSIGEYAFAGCSSLNSVILPDGCVVAETAFSDYDPLAEDDAVSRDD